MVVGSTANGGTTPRGRSQQRANTTGNTTPRGAGNTTPRNVGGGGISPRIIGSGRTIPRNAVPNSGQSTPRGAANTTSARTSSRENRQRADAATTEMMHAMPLAVAHRETGPMSTRQVRWQMDKNVPDLNDARKAINTNRVFLEADSKPLTQRKPVANAALQILSSRPTLEERRRQGVKKTMPPTNPEHQKTNLDSHLKRCSASHHDPAATSEPWTKLQPQPVCRKKVTESPNRSRMTSPFASRDPSPGATAAGRTTRDVSPHFERRLNERRGFNIISGQRRASSAPGTNPMDHRKGDADLNGSRGVRVRQAIEERERHQPKNQLPQRPQPGETRRQWSRPGDHDILNKSLNTSSAKNNEPISPGAEAPVVGHEGRIRRMLSSSPMRRTASTTSDQRGVAHAHSPRRVATSDPKDIGDKRDGGASVAGSNVKRGSFGKFYVAPDRCGRQTMNPPCSTLGSVSVNTATPPPSARPQRSVSPTHRSSAMREAMGWN